MTTAETHTPGFTCKAAFGLGATSCADFVRAVSAYKAVKQAGIGYVNANSGTYNTRAGLVVFDGLRQLGRFSPQVQPTQVVVVSEVVTLLREVTGVEPLDYQNNRSYEFNFMPVNMASVTRAVQRKGGTATVGFINRDSLGFHIDVAAKTDDFVSAFMSLMANLPFTQRQRMRTAMTAYFVASAPDAVPVVETAQAMNALALPSEINRFSEMFLAEHERYHAAVNSDKGADWVSKKYEVNAYTIAFLRKMVRTVSITAEKVGRARNGNVVEAEKR